jgi:hypothetical protein
MVNPAPPETSPPWALRTRDTMRATSCFALFALLTACGDKDGSTEPPGDDSAAEAPADADGDGAAADLDCDDNDAAVFPGAAEVCDGLDNNCDGQADEGVLSTFYADADADSFGDPGAPVEACAAPAGAVPNDQDCDDAEPTTYPGAKETCDERDNDCDGNTDEGVLQTFYADEDRDGYGDAAVLACALTDGLSTVRGDCDDDDASRAPGAPEVCDEADNDCDGVVDELVESAFYRDGDKDGHGDAEEVAWACAAPEGYASLADDCDDSNSDIFPSAAELCDTLDNDCDGLTDEDNLSTFYADADGDGHGSAAAAIVACGLRDGYAAAATDCDDADADISPDATEGCTDGVDNDCDGATDEGALSTYYLDADADGHAGDSTVLDCALLDGYYTSATDCDDTDEDISPDARELCGDSHDNDCDGTADESGCVEPIPTEFTGTFTFEYAFEADPKARPCDLVFDTTAVTASTRRACRDCEWALDYSLVYDAASSTDTMGCHDGSDIEFTFGYDEDYYGYEVLVYYSPYYRDWSPLWEASWDKSTGLLIAGGGYEEYPYPYGSKTYYYTRVWSVYGTTN